MGGTLRKEGTMAARDAERNVRVLHPMLADVAGAAPSPADVVNPLRQFCRGVTVSQGAVDLAAKADAGVWGGSF